MTFRTTSAREADTFTEQTKAPQFSLYPNPSQGNFTLSFEAETTDSRLVEILDMTGRSILKQSYDVVPGKNEISFDLTARPHGVYLLKTDTYSAKILVE